MAEYIDWSETNRTTIEGNRLLGWNWLRFDRSLCLTWAVREQNTSLENVERVSHHHKQAATAASCAAPLRRPAGRPWAVPARRNGPDRPVTLMGHLAQVPCQDRPGFLFYIYFLCLILEIHMDFFLLVSLFYSISHKFFVCYTYS